MTWWEKISPMFSRIISFHRSRHFSFVPKEWWTRSFYHSIDLFDAPDTTNFPVRPSFKDKTPSSLIRFTLEFPIIIIFPVPEQMIKWYVVVATGFDGEYWVRGLLIRLFIMLAMSMAPNQCFEQWADLKVNFETSEYFCSVEFNDWNVDTFKNKNRIRQSSD